ncbi:MAG: uL15 family ribosomal protein [Clostridia bacterium]|nr:uL15 family ribosomal protein [Clostridia bacterium]
MKKFLCKRVLPILMTVVMLISACMPIGAYTLAAPNESAEDPYYKIVFEDGNLRIQLNPQKVYEMVRDGSVTKEELSKFMPEDVYAVLEKGKGVSLDDLNGLLASYITPDLIDELKNLIPTEVLVSRFDLSMFEGILTVDELLSVISLDQLMATVSEEDLTALITTEVLELLLNETVKNEVLDETFVENLLFSDDQNTVINKILENDDLKAELIGLVDDAVVEKLLDDPTTLDRLVKLIESDGKAYGLLHDSRVLTGLSSYLRAHPEQMYDFLSQKGVVNGLKRHPEIFLHEDIIELLVEDGVIHKDNILTLFEGKDEIMAELNDLFDDAAIETLLGVDSFVEAVSAKEGLVTVDRIKTLCACGYLSAETVAIVNEERINALQEDVAAMREFCAAYGIDDADLERYYKGEITASDLLTDLGDDAAYSLIVDGYASVNETLAKELLIGELTDPNNGDRDGLLSLVIPWIEGENGFDVEEYWDCVDDDTFAVITAEILTPAKIHSWFATHPESFAQLFSTLESGTVDRMYEAFHNMPQTDIVTIMTSHISEVAQTVGMEAFFEFNGFNTVDLIHEIGGERGFYYLIDANHVTIEEVAKAIGEGDESAGYQKLLRLIGTGRILEEIGVEPFLPYVNFTDIITAAGGYNQALTWYSYEEMASIARAIGADRLRAFLTDTGIVTNLDLKGIATDVAELLRGKTPQLKALAKECVNRLSQIFLVDVESITVNGTRVVRYGTVDLQALVTEVLQAIPDIDTFLAMSEGDVFAALCFEVIGIDDTFRTGLTVSVEFMGDFTQLQEFAEAYADYFRFDVSDDLDVAVQSTLPSVVADLYEKVLTADKVPDTLKKKLLSFPTMTVGDAAELLRGLSEEELRLLVDTFEEKLESIRDKAYDAIDGKLGAVTDKVGAAAKAEEAAKAAVEKVLGMVTDTEKLRGGLNKAARVIEASAATFGADTTVADWYVANGQFLTDEFTLKADLYETINRFLSLPDNILPIFNNNMTVTGTLALDLTLTDVYRLKITDEEAEIHTFFLPAGVSSDVLADFDLAYEFEEGWTMPAADTELFADNLYLIEFYREDGTLVGTVGYTEDKAPNEKLYPAVPVKNGYTGVWENFTSRLWTEKVIKVYPVYTAETYTVTFRANGKTVGSFTYTVEDHSNRYTPDVPDRTNYGYINGAWYVGATKWSNYKLTYGDVTVEAVYELKTFNGSIIAYKGLDAEKWSAENLKFTFDVEHTSLWLTLPEDPTHLVWGHTFDTFYIDEDHDGVLNKDVDTRLEKYVPEMRMFRMTRSTEVTWEYPLPEGYLMDPENVGDLDLLMSFTVNEYTVTFQDKDGKPVETHDGIYTVLEPTIVTPDVPPVAGKTGYWYVCDEDGNVTNQLWSDYDLTESARDITVQAVYTPIDYFVTFYDKNGLEVGQFRYDVEDYSKVYTPDLPRTPDYYVDGSGEWWIVDEEGNPIRKWSENDLFIGNFTVQAFYTPIEYTVTFKDAAGAVIATDTYTVEEQSLRFPDLSEYQREHYRIVWDLWNETTQTWEEWNGMLPFEDMIFAIRYVPIQYHVYFYANDGLYTTLTYTVEDDSELVDALGNRVVPTVPDELGYTGQWYVYVDGEKTVLWEDYDYVTYRGDVEVRAVYDVVKYTVTFKDAKTGNTLDMLTITYTIKDDLTAISIPDTPQVAYYENGRWCLKDGNDNYVPWDQLLNYENLTVYAVYDAIEYTVVFKDAKTDVTIDSFTYTFDTIGSVTIPSVPTKDHYENGRWCLKDGNDTYVGWNESLNLESLTVYAVYDAVEYTVTFKDAKTGATLDEISYTIEDDLTSITIPSVPAKTGYENGRWCLKDGNDYELWDKSLNLENLTVYAVYDAIKYTAEYTYGNISGSVLFDVEQGGFELPIPSKEHYTFDAWYIDVDNSGSVTAGDIRLTMQQASTFGLRRNTTADTAMFLLPAGTEMSAGNIKLYASFTANLYNVYFVEGEQVKLNRTYTVEDWQFEVPNITPKTGYTAQWCYKDGESYLPWSIEMLQNGGDVTVYAVYTPITYTATFKVDGQVIGTVTFTVEQTELTGIPAVPAKKGYNGVWSSYEIKAEDMTIEAVYTLINYTATFIADGIEIAKVNFTVLDTSIEEPEVPAKEGYTGVWQSYTLDAADVVIHAVYTPIDEGDEGGFPWWILILIPVLVVAMLVILLLVWKNRQDDDDDTTPPPAPVVVPEPEPEPTPEAPVVLETVDVDTADAMMSDADAMAAMEIVMAARVTGPKEIVNIHQINDAFEAGETVDLEALKAKKILTKKTTRYKVLADGHLDKPLTVIADQFSVQAIKMITLTGGHAIQKK